MSQLPGNPAPANLIFVHIQKTGGSSISHALKQPHHPPHKHWFAPELRELVGVEAWDRATKFTFVRNPWDRLVSWWSMIDRARVMQRPGIKMNNFFTYVLGNASTFEEFILKCPEDIQDLDGRKCVFRNQLDYVMDDAGNLMVDFIGKFENLQDDFNKLTEISGLPASVLERRNPSVHKPYQDYYSATTRDAVEQAYQKDIAHFGYRFEG